MKNHRLPAAVISDMDGVLADTEPLHAECFVRVYAGFGVKTTVEEYRRGVTIGGMGSKGFYISIGGDPATWDELAETKAVMFKQVIDERAVIRPGVREFFGAVKESGIPTALATSAGRRSLDIILGRFDLWRYFDEFVTWQDVTAEKPDPEAFLIAANKLGVNPEECVAVEDSPRGVLAAYRAGMKCLAVPTPATEDGDFSPAALVVDSLAEVDLETLRRLFQSAL